MITNFNVNPSLVLAGSPDFNPIFTVTSSGLNISSAYIEDDFFMLSATFLSSPYTGVVYNYPFGGSQLPPNEKVNFTLTVDLNPSGYLQKNTQMNVGQKNYYGFYSYSSGVYNSGFINNLNNYVLSTGIDLTVSPLTTGNYLWVAAPSRYNPLSLRIAPTGSSVFFNLLSSGVSYSNGSGYTENYSVWRSNSKLGIGNYRITK